MTVGTGIFAATVLVILYLTIRNITKAGRWRLVGKISLFVFGVLAILGLGTWQWVEWTNRPEPVIEMAGVRLGMSPMEVKLAKGAPSFGNDDAAEKAEDSFSLFWGYGKGLPLMIEFRGKDPNYLRMSFVCEREGYSKLFGLGHYSSEKDVRDALGIPSKASIDKEGLAQMLSFKQWNVAFELRQNSVVMVCLTDHELEYAEPYVP